MLDGAEPTVDQLLDLQRDAGNGAVVSLLGTLRPVQREVVTLHAVGAAGPGGQVIPIRRGPSDIDLGFNALDIAHRLIESIDQKEVKILKEGDPGYVKGIKPLARQIDFKVVHDQLSGLTAGQVKQVEARYAEYVGRPLYVDLFRGGESGYRPNLSFEQEQRLKALLGGTRAEIGEDPEAAAGHQREADAHELRGILKGSPKGTDIERVMTLLRRTPEEGEKLIRLYDGNWNLRSDLLRMGFTHAVRAMMLLSGSHLAADAHAINGHRLRVVEIDKTLLELDPPGVTASDVLMTLGGIGAGGGAIAVNKATIKALKAERKQHVDAIEERVKLTADEARAAAEAEGKDVLGTDEAIRARVTAVLGGDDATERAVGGTQAKLIGAVRRADPSEQTAAEMRKLDERGDLTTEVMAQLFRNLRQQAEVEAQRLYPDDTADQLAEHTRKLSDRWFIHLRSTWDASVVGTGKTFDQLLDRGKQTEVDFKRQLYMASGKLSDVDELVLALRGDRKDLETVKRILRDKTHLEIMELKRLYKIKTTTPQNKWGGSLDEDLLGYAPTTAGAKDTRRSDEPAGKAQGTDRLLIEDYLKRPWREGGKEEVDYIVGRAEREHQYTMDNKGATGWWRDHWGNEAKSLIDATLKEVREKRDKYYALTKDGTDRKAMRSREAKLLIREMHFARATIRGDRAGYEKATAELRATFQAIASFVLQAVLTAVLSPAAAALFRGISAAAAATRYGIWLKNTVVNMASTIAANKAVHGNEYTRDMLFADLRGGLSGAIGSAAVGRLVQPVATRLQSRLGKEMAGEFVEGVKTYGGMQATAVLEGQGLVSFNDFAKEHFLGKVGEKITGATSKGLGHLGYGPGPTHAPYDPDAPTKTKSGAKPETATDDAPGAGDRRAKTADADVDVDADYVPPPTPMALPPELNKPAPRVRTTERPPSPKEASQLPVEPPKVRGKKPVEEDLEPADSDKDTKETEFTPDMTRRMAREAEQARRAEANPLDEASLRGSTAPTARTRVLAAEFAPLFESFKTTKDVVPRSQAIAAIVQRRLREQGVHEVGVFPADLGDTVRADFDVTLWQININSRTLAVQDLTVKQFSDLVEAATHEARHALHHWRGLRAALGSDPPQFRTDSLLKPNAEAVEAARLANASTDPKHQTTKEAMGEALEVYQQTFGKDTGDLSGEKGRARIINELESRRKEHAEAKQRATDLPEGSTQRQAAELAAASAYERWRMAYNKYVKLPQETDAFRRGMAMHASMMEALLLPRIDTARTAAREAHAAQVEARRRGNKDDAASALKAYEAAAAEARRLQTELNDLPHRSGQKTTLDQDLAFADEVRQMALKDRERAMAEKDQAAVADANRRHAEAVQEMRQLKAEIDRRRRGG